MTTHQYGDTYVLTGNSQSATIEYQQTAMVFAYGSGDAISNYYTPDLTAWLGGGNETIEEYGGDPSMTIFGWRASDVLTLYAQITGAVGVILPPGSPVTAASLHSDGHGGWDMPLAYNAGAVDFKDVSERTVLASHIVASVR